MKSKYTMLLFLLLIVISMTTSAAAKTEPTATPVSERQQLLNKRLAFVKERKQIESEIVSLKQQIKATKEGSSYTDAATGSKISPPKSLQPLTFKIVLINFFILSIVMIVRHKTQEPKS